MKIPQIQQIRSLFEKMKNELGTVSDWSMPFGELITRPDSAVFFFTPSDEKYIPDITAELKEIPGFRYGKNTELKLSGLDYKIEFKESEKVYEEEVFEHSNCRSELISEDEKNTILDDLYSFSEYAPQNNMSLPELFDIQAERSPGSPALIFNDKELSYIDLANNSGRLAEILCEKGAERGDIVAVMMNRSFEMVTAILAVFKAGCIYLPLDPSYPDAALRKMTVDSSAQYIITGLHRPGITDGLTVIDPKDIPTRDKGRSVSPEMIRKRSHDRISHIIYTSGSSGTPKGVMGTEKGMINRLEWGWKCFPAGTDAVACFRSSPAFVDHIAEILSPLLQGIPAVIIPEDRSNDPAGLVEILSKHNVTRITLVPPLLKGILDLPEQKISELKSLRYVFCSGEHLPAGTISAFKSRMPEASLINIYGSSEVSADVSWFTVVMGKNNISMKYFYADPAPGKIPDSLNVVRDGTYTLPDSDFQKLLTKFSSTVVPPFPLTVGEYYEKLKNDVLPYTVDTNSPYFVGHMTSKLPFYVHELSLFISMLNQNMVKLETSKSLTAVEKQTLGMLHRKIYRKKNDYYDAAFADPDSNFGVFTSCGTIANITSLLVARNKSILGGKETSGSVFRIMNSLGYQDAVIIGSGLMHYSMNKAASVLGFGKDNIIYVRNGSDGRMDISHLEEIIEKCKKEKIFIIAAVGIAGATETGQIDPLKEIALAAEKHGIHFHVDAAWGGPIIFSDKYSHLLSGIEKADSVTICGHKQFYLPQGVSLCLFKDADSLSAIQVNARYQALPNSYDTGRISIEGSRPATSLLLHSVLHIFGQNGLEYLINSGIDKAKIFSEYIDHDPAFELMSEPVMNIVNYRYIPVIFREKLKNNSLTEDDNSVINSINDEIQKRQFSTGKTFVSKTVLFNTKYGSSGVKVFRVVISNPLTNYSHLLSNIGEQLKTAYEISLENGDISHFCLEEALKTIRNFEEVSKPNSVIGKPIPNTGLYVVDSSFRLVPAGDKGELIVTGAGLCAGYLNMPELTAEKFIWWEPAEERVYPCYEKPRTAVRAYRTGDICRRLKDGNFEYTGRADHQIKIGGYRLEPEEIESQILKIDGIMQCVVKAKENTCGEKHLSAYIVSEISYTEKELRKILSGSVPEYAIPAYFIFLKDIPLTGSGKIDRKALS